MKGVGREHYKEGERVWGEGCVLLIRLCFTLQDHGSISRPVLCVLPCNKMHLVFMEQAFCFGTDARDPALLYLTIESHHWTQMTKCWL